MVGTLCYLCIAICFPLCFDESTLKEKYFVFRVILEEWKYYHNKGGGKTTAYARFKETVSFSKSRKVVRYADFSVSFLFPFFLTYIDSLFSVVWRTAPKGATDLHGSNNVRFNNKRWWQGANPTAISC